MADAETDPLAAELRALAGWLDVPEPPDLRAAVRLRLASSSTVDSQRWVPRRRRLLAAALAVAVAVLVAVLPPARAAVAGAVTGLLRFAGVEVHQGAGVREVPVSPSPLPSTTSALLDDARRRALFPIGVPRMLGAPQQVLLADPGPDGAPRVVSLLYRGGTVRLDEFDGTLDPVFQKETAVSGQWIQIGDGYGVWFSGPQTVEYIDRLGVRHTETARLARPTLIWSRGSVTYRLEGLGTLDEARAVALSI